MYYGTRAPNVEIHERVAKHIGKCAPLLQIVKNRWFAHVGKEKGTPANPILHGKVDVSYL